MAILSTLKSLHIAHAQLIRLKTAGHISLNHLDVTRLLASLFLLENVEILLLLVYLLLFQINVTLLDGHIPGPFLKFGSLLWRQKNFQCSSEVPSRFDDLNDVGLKVHLIPPQLKCGLYSTPIAAAGT